jgi:hypothetical protein
VDTTYLHHGEGDIAIALAKNETIDIMPCIVTTIVMGGWMSGGVWR